jgi:hypothetical protein
MNCPDNVTVTPIEPCPVCDAEPAIIEIRLHDVPDDHVCTVTPEESWSQFMRLLGQPFISHIDCEP